uniref:Uncharacterized protein n=1 Tax=Timema monikensis TaxID=170555 RepID=A0A7R9E6Z5_9NEOP|nr:unnamed protein product [Timema monikensis]
MVWNFNSTDIEDVLRRIVTATTRSSGTALSVSDTASSISPQLTRSITVLVGSQRNAMRIMSNAVKVNGETVTVDPLTIFQKTAIAKKSDGDVAQLMEYKLSPFPLALFNEGVMRKEKKSSLYDAFPEDNYETHILRTSTNVLLDGGFLLHHVKWNMGTKISVLCDQYIAYVLKHYGQNCTVVFNGYGDVNSTKRAEQKRRGRKKTSVDINFNESMNIKQWLNNPLPPTEWGWNRGEDGSLTPVTIKDRGVPEAILNNIFCRCSSGCGGRYGCRKAGIPCSMVPVPWYISYGAMLSLETLRKASRETVDTSKEPDIKGNQDKEGSEKLTEMPNGLKIEYDVSGAVPVSEEEKPRVSKKSQKYPDALILKCITIEESNDSVAIGVNGCAAKNTADGDVGERNKVTPTKPVADTHEFNSSETNRGAGDEVNLHKIEEEIAVRVVPRGILATPHPFKRGSMPALGTLPRWLSQEEDDLPGEGGGTTEPPATPVGRDELALRRHRFFSELLHVAQAGAEHRVHFDPLGPKVAAGIRRT